VCWDVVVTRPRPERRATGASVGLNRSARKLPAWQSYLPAMLTAFETTSLLAFSHTTV